MNVIAQGKSGGLGDVICRIPALRQLRRMSPRAHIAYEDDPYYLDLLRGVPEVNELRPFQGLTRRARKYRRQSSALVVDLFGCAARHLQAAGFKPTLSRTELYCIEAGGLPDDLTPRLHLHEDEIEWARTWIAERRLGRPVVGIALRSSDALKDYPCWQEVAERLAPMASLVAMDRDRQVQWAANAVGLSIRQIAALIHECDLMIGSDSGVMHLAAAVGTQGLWLFGPTDPITTLRHYPGADFLRADDIPAQVGCLMPCYGDIETRRCKCLPGHAVCMSALPPADVGRRALTILRGDAPRLRAGGAPLSEARVPNDSLKRCEVSILIVGCNRGDATAKCIQSVAGFTGGVDHEVILVDNGATDTESRRFFDQWPGKIVRNKANLGYVRANNQAAAIACGEFLVLLNNDTIVREGWLTEMLKMFRADSLLGIVGNKHLKDGRIQSAGSEYDPEGGNFPHRFKGADPNLPEANAPCEVDVVTGACLMIRKSVWDALGGLDEDYRVIYWEDTDLCMRARAAGWRIKYCPASVIEHECGGSGLPAPWYSYNRELFHERWIRSGRFEKIRVNPKRWGRIVGCIIALNEEEYIGPCLESIYDFCDQIVIVEGGNPYSSYMCRPDGGSTDGTVGRIQEFIRANDGARKVRLLRGKWRDKTQQRNRYCEFLEPGDWMFMADADDVFKPDGLAKLRSAMLDGYELITFDRYNFWNDFDHYGTGKWDEFVPVSLLRWRERYRYDTHTTPSARDGVPVGAAVTARIHIKERLAFHYAYVKPLRKIRNKVEYYRRQPTGGEVHPRYVEEVFLRWRSDPRAVEDGYGTHLFGGGGAARFTSAHPRPIAGRIAQGTYRWLEKEAER